MGKRKRTIFALGYSDNTSTAFILNHLIQNGVTIDGAIFPKTQPDLGWKRLKRKIQARGFLPATKRIFENIFLRKNQISKICQQHIEKVFSVDEINSEETRKILMDNRVDLLLLTATPIIKPIIVDIDGLTILNAHTGWLPKFRGLDANLKALRDGHPPGVSLHRVSQKIDAGEIYLRETFEIDYGRNILEQIDNKELELAARLFLQAIRLIEKNVLKPIALDEPLGKYEPPIPKQEKDKIARDLKKRHLQAQ